MKQALLLLTAGLILVGGVFIFAERAGLTKDFAEIAVTFMNVGAAEPDLVIPAEVDGACKEGYSYIPNSNGFCRLDAAVEQDEDGGCPDIYYYAGQGLCLPDPVNTDFPDLVVPAEVDGTCKEGYEVLGNNFCQHEEARRANSSGNCPTDYTSVGGGWCLPNSAAKDAQTEGGGDGDDGGIDWFFPEGGFVPCGKRGDAEHPTTAVQEPCNICHAAELGQNILNFLVTTVMPFLAILFSAIGGFLIMTAGGNENRYREGRDQLVRVAVGILIILMAWAGINFLMSTFFNEEVTGSWYEFECKVPQEPDVPIFVPGEWRPGDIIVEPGGPIEPGEGDNVCRQSFGASHATGCPSGPNDCVSANSLVDFVDCNPSGGGVCKVSRATYSRLQTLLNAYYSNSAGQCEIGISSALQFNGGPSQSACHKVGNNLSGTCVDFNLRPYNETCRQAFYRAAGQSGVVTFFLDEYQNSCKASTTTGGNIHTEF